jgi:transposase
MAEAAARIQRSLPHHFETAPNLLTAATRLEDWFGEVRQSSLNSLTKFVTTLRNWWEVIRYYFHAHLIKRRGFGHCSFDHFRLRVLVECDDGREAH